MGSYIHARGKGSHVGAYASEQIAVTARGILEGSKFAARTEASGPLAWKMNASDVHYAIFFMRD